MLGVLEYWLGKHDFSDFGEGGNGPITPKNKIFEKGFLI